MASRPILTYTGAIQWGWHWSWYITHANASSEIEYLELWTKWTCYASCPLELVPLPHFDIWLLDRTQLLTRSAFYGKCTHHGDPNLFSELRRRKLKDLFFSWLTLLSFRPKKKCFNENFPAWPHKTEIGQTYGNQLYLFKNARFTCRSRRTSIWQDLESSFVSGRGGCLCLAWLMMVQVLSKWRKWWTNSAPVRLAIQDYGPITLGIRPGLLLASVNWARENEAWFETMHHLLSSLEFTAKAKAHDGLNSGEDHWQTDYERGSNTASPV